MQLYNISQEVEKCVLSTNIFELYAPLGILLSTVFPQERSPSSPIYQGPLTGVLNGHRWAANPAAWVTGQSSNPKGTAFTQLVPEYSAQRLFCKGLGVGLSQLTLKTYRFQSATLQIKFLDYVVAFIFMKWKGNKDTSLNDCTIYFYSSPPLHLSSHHHS